MSPAQPPYNGSSRYFAYPASLSELKPTQRTGLHILSGVSTLSAVCAFSTLCFLIYRAIFWKRYYISTLVFNQNIILLFNLLIGDLLTSTGYMISFHWSHLDGIFAPTPACRAQGLLLNIGDLVSGCFVFVIAIHTGANLIWSSTIPWKYLTPTILFCWVFSLIISLSGIPIFGKGYITNAGLWCWISPKHARAQLWAHYVWVFLFEFGTLVIYLTTFVIIRRRIVACRSHMRMSVPQSSIDTEQSLVTKSTSRRDIARQLNNSRVNRATWYMIIYPVIYFTCTAPVAANRMYVMSSGKRSPEWVYIFAACCLNCCGWIDCIVYTFTRNVFVKTIHLK